LIFLTVGTLFPFDRLVKAVDEAIRAHLLNDKVFAQIGKSKYKPRNMTYAPTLDTKNFDEKIKQAEYLISHAGIGSITAALSLNKPLLVMPRLKRFGEHVNDHQLGTARKFEKLGHILVAYTEDEVPKKMKQLRSFTPKPRKVQTEAVVNRISTFLNGLQK